MRRINRGDVDRTISISRVTRWIHEDSRHWVGPFTIKVVMVRESSTDPDAPDLVIDDIHGEMLRAGFGRDGRPTCLYLERWEVVE